MPRAEPAGVPGGTVLRGCPQGHPNPQGHRHCGECGALLVGTGPPMWSSLVEAITVIRYPAHLHRTLLTTVIVGIVLFCINQLDVVLAGEATAVVWAKGGLTFVVPFAVSNIGILIATHRRR